MPKIKTPWDRDAGVDRPRPSNVLPSMDHDSDNCIDAVPTDPPEPRFRWTAKITPDRVVVQDIRLADGLMGDGPEKPADPSVRVVASERELPIFLVPADVAALLRTTPKAIYAKVERGLLPGVVRDGTRVLFDRDVLLRELRRGRGR